MISQQKFPKDFLWGASTASHQVEGNGGTEGVNQWSVWELAHAGELAVSAEKRLLRSAPAIVNSPDWKDIRPQATDPQNYVSGAGIDHYGRYEEDFDLLEQLHMNSFRFGIEWARIQPKEGAWNGEAIRHYHGYIDSLLKRGITPVLTIWHWTMPTWFTEKGGFEKKENLVFFDNYVAKIAEEYGDKLKYVITLNEPNVYASFSYATGEWPPQQKKPLLMFKVYRHLAAAHRRAYALLKAANPALQVGIAAQLGNIQPKRPANPLDSVVTGVMGYAWNWYFLNRIRRHQDFIGINYYFTNYYKNFGSDVTPHVPANDLGWYMEPEGIYQIVSRTWGRYKKPILITENGVADRKDQYRQWWIEQTMIALQRAMSDGVELKGYLHWSLLDNFEWAYGWWPKFGLVAVDRDNDMERSLRPSAVWFGELIDDLRQGRAPRQTSRPVAGVAPRKPVVMESKEQSRPEAKPAAKTSENRAAHKASSARRVAEGVRRLALKPQAKTVQPTPPNADQSATGQPRRPGGPVRLDLNRLRRRRVQ